MRVLLHLGQHKTGSKALQSALYGNREFLADGGYSFPIARGLWQPRPYELNHFPLFQTVRKALAKDGNSRDAVSAVRAHLRPLLSLRETNRETRIDGEVPTVILSSEDLFDMHTAHEAEFLPERVWAGAHLLAESLRQLTAEVRLVVYLRRQDHLLAAHFGQFIKGTGHNHADLAGFLQRFAARFNLAANLAAWESAFGVERVKVLPYERGAMPEGIVGDFFGRVLGLGLPPLPAPFPGDLEASNITPSRDQIEFMRCLNRRCARGKRVLHRAQVLEAALVERAGARRGIDAWWSPAERSEFLARHAAGNRQIAQRHGLGDVLFDEAEPDINGVWSPPPELDLVRLVEFDARARSSPAIRPAWRRLWWRLRHWWGGRQALWIVPSQVAAGDAHLATRWMAGLVGCPELQTQIVPGLVDVTLPKGQLPLALVVLVGADAAAAVAAPVWRSLRNRRVPVVILLGESAPHLDSLQVLRTLAGERAGVICATPEIRDEVAAAIPALANRLRQDDTGNGERCLEWLETLVGI